MAKAKLVYLCSQCGAESPKWVGKCPQCGEWNTYQEEVIERPSTGATSSARKSKITPVLLSEVRGHHMERWVTPDQELNRVLGGGIVPGSIVLIGGQPGIGKSTLLLQLALQLSGPILYVSGEESGEQIRLRADRMQNAAGREEHANQCYLLAETQLESIRDAIHQLKPALVIIDSIQTTTVSYLDSVAGSITQVRESAAELQKIAKSSHIPVFLIGHITKDGHIAGPKILEHLVDTVLQFEGDRNYTYRILRTLKNRFGSTDELGIYEMLSGGLREVHNPSELLLSEKEYALSGCAIAAMVEGLRPMLIEVQALVSSAVYGTPQRSSTGFDVRRMHMLLAVLEKRCGFHLGNNDVFLNIAGGLRVEDPGIDLAVVASCMSSMQNVAIDAHTCFTGEVGLSGEIRSVNRLPQRIAEAARLGFKHIYVPKYGFKEVIADSKIKVHPVSRVEELYSSLFR